MRSAMRKGCRNCGEPGRCFCRYCLRAMLVPLVAAELVRLLFGLLSG